MNKICGVYKITNLITGDFYIGSSRDVYQRWAHHKWSSTWKHKPNSSMYRDMEKYGVDKFRFQILAPVMPECLKQVEQDFIELLQPTYNNRRANGIDTKRQKETQRKCLREYFQTEKGKETQKKYQNQPCSYNGETLTLHALSTRFRKVGIEHPVKEAKKYLLQLQ